MLYDYTDKAFVKAFIKEALYEDVRDGDHTSLACIDKDSRTKSRLLVKDDGVLAGVGFAQDVFAELSDDHSFDIRIQDGADIKFGDEAFYIESNSQVMLKAERLVLNMMQRMSGIATLSRQFAKEVEGFDVKILDTRKTTPLMRYFEKEAVAIGGCENYRFGLFDWIMIKDNHVDACGNHTKAIAKVKEYFKTTGKTLGMTVEVRNHKELDEVLAAGGVNRVMLDNFEVKDMETAVKTINKQCEVEASGGVTLSSLKAIAATGVDYISSGALTHSYQSLDLSLKVMK